jgi:hydroxymethylglutaryl-CoA lyase
MLANLPQAVKIMEVGPRDGLQNEKTIIDTARKISLIDRLVDAGNKRVEVTAFVSPRWIPPLADQLEVALGISKKPGVRYAALVPNIHGYDRAMATEKIDEVSIVVAATDEHNIKNLNADTAHVMQRYYELTTRARHDKTPFRAYISCVFGCPYAGHVEMEPILDLTNKLLDLGAYEVSLSDTIGVASPVSTMQVLEYIIKYVPKELLALHMHDTRGTALANIFAALSLGVASFDSSLGGLGGCPYAPGAAGNVASEDLIAMLDAMNIPTGISVEKLCKISLDLEKILHKKLPSKLVAMFRQIS